ncbi:hypothetical protein PC116_g28473 [Phytophthora cactorum]|nr:hypothetical protein PC116_g28473 [Phytophthora cactorum]
MVSILRASTAALACAGSEAMLTPNEYAYGDCCKLILSSYHLGHSGIARSMIRLRRKKKRLSAEVHMTL